jgi:hypothetical protein
MADEYIPKTDLVPDLHSYYTLHKFILQTNTLHVCTNIFYGHGLNRRTIWNSAESSNFSCAYM